MCAAARYAVVRLLPSCNAGIQVQVPSTVFVVVIVALSYPYRVLKREKTREKKKNTDAIRGETAENNGGETLDRMGAKRQMASVAASVRIA